MEKVNGKLLESAKSLSAWAERLLEVTPEPPDSNCSCHISPPCSDCVEYSAEREAREELRSALHAGHEAMFYAEQQQTKQPVNAQLLAALKGFEIVDDCLEAEGCVWLLLRPDVKNTVGGGSIRINGELAKAFAKYNEKRKSAIAAAEAEQQRPKNSRFIAPTIQHHMLGSLDCAISDFEADENANNEANQIIITDLKHIRDALAAAEQLPPASEPVAYAIFAENGNIRIWSAKTEDHVHIKGIADAQGKQITPLYATPQPAVPDGYAPIPYATPCELTTEELRVFKLGWLECEAAHQAMLAAAKEQP